MSTLAFLSHLRQLDIVVTLNGEKLKVSAPQESLTPELRTELQQRKAEIVAVLQNAQDTTTESSPPIQPVRQRSSVPASDAQQRMWFLQQLDPDQDTYNMPVIFELTGPLDTIALEKSMQHLVDRHEILRTTFEAANGHIYQRIINTPSTLSEALFHLKDLSHLDPSARESQTTELLSRQVKAPFNLKQGPLLRINLLKLAEDNHILLIVMHHIITDGWSLNILLKEISRLYFDYASQKPISLPSLPIQYADYAFWQQDGSQKDRFQKQAHYWKNQLAGPLPRLNLATDYARPDVQTHRGASEHLTLSYETSQRLRQFSQEHESSLFMTLLATFKLLLYRLTDQEDLIVGTPIAGRNRADLEPLIGLFLNTLALRTTVSGAFCFLDLLDQIRTTTLDAYEHQDLPFEKLLSELKLERDLSRTPIFQVFFNMLNTGNTELELPHISVQERPLPELGAKFDLTLYASDYEGQIKLHLVYNADLFSPVRMQILMAQFEGILSQIVTQPQQKVVAYSLITPETISLLPNPSQPIPTPSYTLLPDMIRSWGIRTPHQTAIQQENQQWDYQTLIRTAEHIAYGLVSQGLRVGETVAVTGEKSFGLMAGLLGVLLSGGVLLTLDQTLADERQKRMLQIAQAKWMLCVGNGQAAVDAACSDIQIMSLDPLTGNPNSQLVPPDSSVQLPELKPDQPAYIFFTSGTTGEPKAILGNQKGLAHFLHWQRDHFAASRDDRCAQLTGLSFDVVLRDIFLPLVSGATLCLPPKNSDLRPRHILPWLSQEKITIFHTVPSLAELWLNQGDDQVQLHDLRWVFFAGEPLTADLINRLRDSFLKSGHIINLYGPSETTLAKCYYQVPDEPQSGTQPIGQPLPETQILILTTEGQLCGLGESGQIVIRTPFQTLGYLNPGEADQVRFKPNHFQATDPDLLYYTGDIGQYGLNGDLEILGRLDDQIKIRGIRIEPSEIAAVIRTHSSVEQVYVMAKKDQAQPLRLIAYVTTKNNVALTDETLYHFLKPKLPQYLHPATFVWLDTFPLTANGKIDRNQLPSPSFINASNTQHYVPPCNDIEEQLIVMWQHILNVPQIGIEDNFFELGGHSLLAIQLFDQIQQKFSQDLPLSTLFEAPTIAQLAQLMQSDTWSPTWSSLVPIRKSGHKHPLFLIHGGGGQVLFCQGLVPYLDPDRPLYGLQRCEFGSDKPPHTSVQDMATHYIKEIKTIQPEGPYFIGGYCIGGTVAFEMAQQFMAKGDQVDLLALIGAGYPPGINRPARHYGYRALDYIRQGLPLSVWVQTLQNNLERLNRIKKLKTRHKQKLLENAKPQNRRLKRYYNIHPYPGDIVLLETSRLTYDHWAPLAEGSITYSRIPGSHQTIFVEPYVRVLAQHLNTHLEG
ncbi:MAG: amino acid adenylation domain-containing protein [Chloroflexota bacterium]